MPAASEQVHDRDRDGLSAGGHQVPAVPHEVHAGHGNGVPACPDEMSGDECDAVFAHGRDDLSANDVYGRDLSVQVKAVNLPTRAVAKTAALFLSEFLLSEPQAG
jgi:hypothetical protein